MEADLLQPARSPLRIAERGPGFPGQLQGVLYGVFRLLAIAEDREGEGKEWPAVRVDRLLERGHVAGRSIGGHDHI
jgi:hypothetical protein